MPSAHAKSNPEQTKGESKSPAASVENLTAQKPIDEHLPVGAEVETKSGKSGVITHVHKKAGYLFIHNKEQGKTYHVSWASVTKVNGKDPAAAPEHVDPHRRPAGRLLIFCHFSAVTSHR
jgi:hypothetical protein